VVPVPHSCARFLAPDAQDTLAGLLFGLVEDVTRILACPGVPDWGKLSGIQAMVDERAPAPGPEDGIRYAGLKPSAGSACEELIGYITSVRTLLVHTSMLARDRLDEITRLNLVTLSHLAAMPLRVPAGEPVLT
jgi:hypothetical protein